MYGGAVLSAAIDKHVFIALNHTFTPDYFLKYSALERVTNIDDIQHPIIREALRLHNVKPSLEVVSLADIPSGTGLGSSGAFTVGLLKALYSLKRQHATAGALAEEACHIEMELLSYPSGKQDQYISAFGGLTFFEIATDGRVTVSPLGLSSDTLRDLEEHLLMFFTGYSRRADTVLVDQELRTRSGEATMLDNLKYVRDLGLDTKAALQRGDTMEFVELMNEHWRHKQRRSPQISNPAIDRWYELGIANGALGGKLVGAGAGGFLLFYAKDHERLRTAMAAEKLPEVRFLFDYDGATLVARN
jgi:D-glycero-alpha-D-manno-heptose-7-phosphate kinase